MFERFLHFIKYNNATVIIVLGFFVVGAGVFASEPGREAIGQKTNRIEGMDNTLLLAADPDKLAPEFKISKIEQDERYYYVTYTYVELALVKQVWQYQLTERVKRVPLDLREDLGQYLANEFKEEEAALVNRVKQAQAKALETGPAKRQEVTEYSGLIGKVLDLGQAAFPGYEPVKKTELPLPDFAAAAMPLAQASGSPGSSDNLTNVYLDYINSHDLSGLDLPPVSTSTASTSPAEPNIGTAPAPATETPTEPSVASDGSEPAPAPAEQPASVPVEPAAEPEVTVITLPQPATEPAAVSGQ